MTDKAFEAVLSRRTLLAGSVAAALLHGCQPAGQSPSGPPTTGAPSPSPAAATSAAQLLASGQFMVAHRGSGDNWPEHTLTAYRNALAAGADAVEISLRATSDAVLVCHHDEDLLRTTGSAGPVKERTFADLAGYRVDARAWLGQATELEPISRIEDVLTALPDDCLIFIEDKDGNNTAQLLALLDAQPRATARFVWTLWAAAEGAAPAARARGYLTWGYLTSDLFGRAEPLADLHDALGVPVFAATDAQIAKVVAAGKPVVGWEVHTRAERDRLRRLGVSGLMCSNVEYVGNDQAIATSDAFATGRRAAGDLPAEYGTWADQPELRAGDESLVLRGDGTQRYLMGSLAPIQGGNYRIECRVSWVAPPANSAARAGIAFGLGDDGPFHPRQPNASGSQQAYLTANGRVMLAHQAAGWDASERLAELGAGGDGQLAIEVRGDELALLIAGREARVSNGTESGGYLWLWAHGAPSGARFSGLRVSPL